MAKTATKTSIGARYSGICARTGKKYQAGTRIVKNAAGKYEIAPGHNAVETLHLRNEDGTLRIAVFGDRALYCRCVKELPDFDEKKCTASGEFHPECVMQREDGALVCHGCNRRIEIAPRQEVEAKYPPETRKCWECGCAFTYAQCKRNGGDWNENGGYCGC